jgi:hypothetical protein
MQTQKIIYVSLISLLAVSLLIPALSAITCPTCGYDPCICDEDGDMYPGTENGIAFVTFDAEIDKKSVERPTTDTAENVTLYGKLSSYSQSLEEPDLGGKPVNIQVYGPSDTYWEANIYTKPDGSFEFTFEILKTANLGFYDVIVTAAGQTKSVPFEVVGTETSTYEQPLTFYQQNWPWMILLTSLVALAIGYFILSGLFEPFLFSKRCKAKCPKCQKRCILIIPYGRYNHAGMCSCAPGFVRTRAAGGWRKQRRAKAGHRWYPKNIEECR